jgi:Holliday junction resolvase RusA-like endonuclease
MHEYINDRIEMIVLGEPKAQARHRHFQMKGVKHVQTYDPSKSKKGTFASILQDNAPKTPLEGPLSLDLIFYMPRPKNHYGTGKKTGELKPSAPDWHTGRPDIDNLTKFVQDALNKIYWRDDSIICNLTARKMYSENPRTEIVITKLLSDE